MNDPQPITGWLTLSPLERAPSDERLATGVVMAMGPLNDADDELVQFMADDVVTYLREATSFTIDGIKFVPVGSVISWKRDG